MAANEPRFMNYDLKEWAAESGRMTVWGPDDLDADPDLIGVPGSPTVVSGLEQAPSGEHKRIRLTGTPEEIAVRLAEVIREAGG